ncbi:hypothetical protein TeGR_g7065 [Tetraparma gracilis]|uniref:Transposase n=1 Tax=Tetraparma gracilis TaxID=2962635 RepID=A0ABQ6N882_9STRA|nr:hypothetical protein TeGR_g7065 [Tetraparma gracilis]
MKGYPVPFTDDKVGIWHKQREQGNLRPKYGGNKGARKVSDEVLARAYKALQDRGEKISVTEMAQELSKESGTKIGRSTLYKWLKKRKT